MPLVKDATLGLRPDNLVNPRPSAADASLGPGFDPQLKTNEDPLNTPPENASETVLKASLDTAPRSKALIKQPGSLQIGGDDDRPLTSGELKELSGLTYRLRARIDALFHHTGHLAPRTRSDVKAFLANLISDTQQLGAEIGFELKASDVLLNHPVAWSRLKSGRKVWFYSLSDLARFTESTPANIAFHRQSVLKMRENGEPNVSYKEINGRDVFFTEHSLAPSALPRGPRKSD